ncbi:MAG: DNA-deoxyinosine glycosylase [Rhodocyclales bacterium]|nr:DNA-deoxyinosine glycosylase [Rhodocyclales bacterium]
MARANTPLNPLQGFPPVADAQARVLVLGSMPGAASLAAEAYYAHKHNAFWRVMSALLGMPPGLPYAERLQALQAAGIALWDVIGTCQRPGSLDADIVGESVVANDFAGFFAVHRKIGHVFFNGATAETTFRRHALPQLPGFALPTTRLPSTSPAHAALRFEQKLAAWQAVIAAANA